MRLDWTPTQSGAIYCAPACGCGCTRAAFDRATAEAKALAARMGEGWAVRVWENGGWNYSVRRGAATIRPRLDRPNANPALGKWEVVGYECWLDADSIRPQVIEKADTPEDALGIAIQIARGHIQRAHEALATVY